MNIYSETAIICSGGMLLLLFFIKNILQYKKSTDEAKTPVVFLAFLLIYILFILPTGVVALLIFGLYRQFVNLTLKAKHGSKFNGLLEGSDSIHANKQFNNIINILIILEYDEKRYLQSLYDTVRQSIYNLLFLNPTRFPKFMSTFQKSMGYYYMVKNEVKIDDCVKKMQRVEGKEEKLNKENVLKLVTNHSNQSLPKNGTVFWEMLVGTQPIKWSENESNEIKTYPLLLRIHHAIGDGEALLRLLVEAYADNPNIKIVSPELWKTELLQQEPNNNNSCKQNKIPQERNFNFYKQARNLIKLFMTSLYVLFLAPTTLYVQCKAHFQGILHGTSLSTQTILAIHAEVSRENVQKIKRIKHRIPETAFGEILLAAFSASLDEHLAKKIVTNPENITALLPIPSKQLQLQHLTTESSTDISLINKFSLLFFNLPFHVKATKGFTESSLIRRLELLQKQTRPIKKSLHFLVNQWILSVAMGVCPLPLMNICLQFVSCTTALSFLPGPSKLTLYGGSPVRALTFWLSTKAQIGATFSTLTYDGRLQIALNINKAFISNENIAQSIVDGVYKYLDLLDKETV